MRRSLAERALASRVLTAPTRCLALLVEGAVPAVPRDILSPAKPSSWTAVGALAGLPGMPALGILAHAIFVLIAT